MKIIPAILPLRYYDIPFGVEKVVGAANTVQIDFVDGQFAPNRTWPFNNKNEDKLAALLNQDEGLPEWESINYEFDLMLKSPLEYMDTLVALGPSRIIFHIGSFEEAAMLEYFVALPEIVRATIGFGMAIGVDTDPSLVAPYTEYIDTIQCMGIAKIGFQAQAFDERAIEQVRTAKALFPDKTISVDGGVSITNAQVLADAGATSLVVGSAIFQSPDIHGTIDTLKHVWPQATTQSES